MSGAADSNIRKVELDRDDGRLQYEVKIVYNNMEYDFDIDASTGTILSRDVESVWDLSNKCSGPGTPPGPEI